MNSSEIHFKDTGYFSKVVLDYLDEKSNLKEFYQYSPKISSFEQAIGNKDLSLKDRFVLVSSLKDQYQKAGINTDKNVLLSDALKSLAESNTYTVTTGHQLCLFTGPLYFIYKIVSVINLAKELKTKYPKQNFLPVYWMATEDHDLAEINHFFFENKKITLKQLKAN